MKRLGAVAGVVWFAAWTTMAGCAVFAAPPLTGLYLATGMNPSGKPYTCVTTIAEPVKDVFAMKWECGEATSSGAALREKDMLSVTYVTPSPDGLQIGIAIYTIKGNTLVGKWTIPGTPGIFPETLTRDPKAREKMPSPPPIEHPAVIEQHSFSA